MLKCRKKKPKSFTFQPANPFSKSSSNRIRQDFLSVSKVTKTLSTEDFRQATAWILITCKTNDNFETCHISNRFHNTSEMGNKNEKFFVGVVQSCSKTTKAISLLFPCGYYSFCNFSQQGNTSFSCERAMQYSSNVFQLSHRGLQGAMHHSTSKGSRWLYY